MENMCLNECGFGGNDAGVCVRSSSDAECRKRDISYDAAARLAHFRSEGVITRHAITGVIERRSGKIPWVKDRLMGGRQRMPKVRLRPGAPEYAAGTKI